MRQNTTRVAIIAVMTGVVFAGQNFTNTGNIFILVAREGLNIVFPDSPAMTVFNLLPIFALTLCLGGELSGDLTLSGVYGFTRGSTRTKWYLTRVAQMAVYSVVFWLSYGLAYAAVITIISPTALTLTGFDLLLKAVFLYLAPFTLISLLWTNLISIKGNITIACVCSAAAHCLCLFALLIALNAGSVWGTVLNPLANASYTLWSDGIEGLVNPKLMPFSYIYWLILLGVTVAVQLRYYTRADILD
jgi:hypothetical protein